MERHRTTGAHAAPVVLTVEDNDAMRALMRGLLEEVTPSVHECADAEHALDLYPRLRPDWVLMDIRMSGMDGIAATRALRRLDPEARVIIVTEHAGPQYRDAARAAGARGFVLKENLLDLPPLLASSNTPSPSSAQPAGETGRGEGSFDAPER